MPILRGCYGEPPRLSCNEHRQTLRSERGGETAAARGTRARQGGQGERRSSPSTLGPWESMDCSQSDPPSTENRDVGANPDNSSIPKPRTPIFNASQLIGTYWLQGFGEVLEGWSQPGDLDLIQRGRRMPRDDVAVRAWRSARLHGPLGRRRVGRAGPSKARPISSLAHNLLLTLNLRVRSFAGHMDLVVRPRPREGVFLHSGQRKPPVRAHLQPTCRPLLKSSAWRLSHSRWQ